MVMRKNNKKRFYIFALVFMMFFMGIGYSIFSKSMNISVNARPTSRWDIHFDTITPATTGKAISKNIVKSNNSLSASFVVDLYEAGDSAEYTIKVVNDGNIPAKLDDVIIDSDDNNYVTMSTTAQNDINSVLDAGGEYSFKVNISVNDDVQLEDALGLQYMVTLYYVQAD